MRVGVLGPLLVVDDGGFALPVTGGRLRVLLASLVARANQVVSVDELAELVWDGAPPAGATGSIRVYVTRLRQALTPEPAERIVTRGPGYLWQADTHEVDLLEFQDLCRRGGEAAQNGDWAVAADLLTGALALWRDTPLVDVPSNLLRDREVPRLERLRRNAIEDRIEADLGLGRHRRLLPELRELVERHPLRERLHAQLMLALARGGNRAEALDAYERARRILHDELGIDPGAELRAVHEQVLAGTVDPEPARPVPRQLPADVPHFTGRDEELRALTALVDSATEGAVVVSAIDGTGGVGKTALAVHWARQQTDRFPDGQLYVNLRGYDPERPMPAGEALAGFLRAIGVPGPDIPADSAERAIRYRSLLADRRMLVVADNAGTVEQVRPLLPGAPGCVLLVTSRDRLAGLVARDGARRITLDTLSEAEAVRLLRALIGSRVDADPPAAARLADLCSRLPLALRVVAELAASKPAVPLAELVAELRDRRRRLDLLDAGGDPLTAVRTVFSWSYQQLDHQHAAMFRLLGLHPGADIDIHAAAALTGSTPAVAGKLLDALVTAHLVVPVPPGRYTMHDLLRAYAVELVAEHDGEQRRRSAMGRLFDHYLRASAAAMDTLFPAERAGRPVLPPPADGLSLDDPDSARGWLDTERANLVAVAAHAGAEHVTPLASVLFRYLDVGGHNAEGLAIYTDARRAAHGAGDRTAEAMAVTSLGTIYRRQGRYREAESCHREALALLRDTGDRTGQARALANLGVIHETHYNRHDEAAAYFREAMALFRETGDRAPEAFILNSLGDIEATRGRLAEAATYFERSLALFREIGHAIGEASVLDGLGDLAMRRGDHAGAIGYFGQAVAAFRAAGDRSAETYARNGLGRARLAVGDTTAARAEHAGALELATGTGDRLQQAHAHAGLAAAYEADGDPDAPVHWRAALDLYTELDAPEAARVRAHLDGTTRAGVSEM